MLKFFSLCVLFALALIPNFSSAQNSCGYDVSTQAGNLTLQNFKCLRSYCLIGLKFMVFELMDIFGHLNPSFLNNYHTAQSANVKSIDAYVPFTDFFTPSEICNNITNNLPSGFSGTVWLYVQSAGWLSTNTTANLDYIVSVAEQCEISGLNIGIGSSNTTWAQITGNATSSFLEAFPLWDINDDHDDEFSDWNRNNNNFGSWTAPTMKQSIANFYFLGCPNMPQAGVSVDSK